MSMTSASATPRRPRIALPAAADALAAGRLRAVCKAVETAIGLVAQRTEDARIAVAARSAGAFVASIRSRVGERARAMGLAGIAGPSAPLRDRLRLEWLASGIVPGRTDVLLLEECARLIAESLRVLPPQHAFAEEVARLRLARAEAYSLGRAIALETPGDLLFALA